MKDKTVIDNIPEWRANVAKIPGVIGAAVGALLFLAMLFGLTYDGRPSAIKANTEISSTK